MRKGALVSLKVKHLIDKQHDEVGISIFEIVVYEGEAEEYHAQCTPEARQKIEGGIWIIGEDMVKK